jgi:hypothetical protein
MNARATDPPRLHADPHPQQSAMPARRLISFACIALSIGLISIALALLTAVVCAAQIRVTSIDRIRVEDAYARRPDRQRAEVIVNGRSFRIQAPATFESATRSIDVREHGFGSTLYEISSTSYTDAAREWDPVPRRLPAALLDIPLSASSRTIRVSGWPFPALLGYTDGAPFGGQPDTYHHTLAIGLPTTSTRFLDGRLPTRILWPGLIANASLWAALLTGARLVYFHARTRSRARRALCIHCGYPASLAEHAPCPECGTPR